MKPNVSEIWKNDVIFLINFFFYIEELSLAENLYIVLVYFEMKISSFQFINLS